jgi:hypothetical protein
MTDPFVHSVSNTYNPYVRAPEVTSCWSSGLLVSDLHTVWPEDEMYMRWTNDGWSRTSLSAGLGEYHD